MQTTVIMTEVQKEMRKGIRCLCELRTVVQCFQITVLAFFRQILQGEDNFTCLLI